MQAISRWRSLLNSRIAASFSPIQTALIHSTSACNARSKKKLNHDFSRCKPRLSEPRITFTVREKCTEKRKALKNLLHNFGALETSFKDGRSRKKVDKKSSRKAEVEYDSDDSTPKRRSKKHPVDKAKSHLKQKLRRGYLADDEEAREAAFREAYRKSSSSWHSNTSDNSSYQNSNSGFEGTQDSYSKNWSNKKWKAASDTDSDDEEDIGSPVDRTTLGLPPSGPLKMADVKNAFHLSALKWHPDKHQGSSQDEAEEKFKQVLTAYRSLCNAISSA